MENLTETFKLHSDSIAEIAKALSKAAAGVTPALRKNENPFFKSQYADLKEIDHSIRKALIENELAISQIVIPMSQMPHLVTILMHSSGEWVKSYYPITYDKTTPQAIGSGVTYARRYSLAAIMNVVTEDDDAEAATKRDSLQKPIEKPTEKPKVTLTPKALLLEKMNKAGDLLELQSIVANAPEEFKTEKFNEYVKTLEQKFSLEMVQEVFDVEETKPTFEETAMKHNKTLKPKGAK